MSSHSIMKQGQSSLIQLTSSINAYILKNYESNKLDVSEELQISSEPLFESSASDESGKNPFEVQLHDQSMVVNAYVLTDYKQALQREKQQIAGIDIAAKYISEIEKWDNEYFVEEDIDLLNVPESSNKQIEKYEHVFVQTKTQYAEIVEKVSLYLESLHHREALLIKIVEKPPSVNCCGGIFSRSKPKMKQKEAERQIQEIKAHREAVIEKSYFLTRFWKSISLERIICLHQNRAQLKANFYVYRNFNKGDYFECNGAIDTKNSIIISNYTRRNKANLQGLGEEYQKSMKKLIINQLLANKSLVQQDSEEEEEEEDDELGSHSIDQFKGLQLIASKDAPIVLPESDSSMQEPQLESSRDMTKPRYSHKYERSQLLSLAHNWRQSVIRRTKRRHLYIEPRFICLPKMSRARTVTLQVEKGIDDKKHSRQRQQINFKYRSQDENSLYFQPIKTDNFLRLDYEMHRNIFQVINFTVDVTDENSRAPYTLKNSMKVAKIENEHLGFLGELGLIPESKERLPQNFKSNYPYVLIFEGVVRSTTLDIMSESVHRFREVALLDKIGKIPNLYSSFYEYNYKLSDASLFDQIFNEDYRPTKHTIMTKRHLEQSYLRFANFFQHQQNKSQNYCLYLSQTANKQCKTGYTINNRYKQYRKHLTLKIKQITQNYQEMYSIMRDEIQIQKTTKKIHIPNLTYDMKNSDLFLKDTIETILQRYILYCDYMNRKKKSQKNVFYHQSMIKIVDSIIELYERSEQRQELLQIVYTKQQQQQLTVFVIAFLQQIYPYHALSMLQTDLYHMRALVQKFLPEYNLELNREGIGLEQECSNHLLPFFKNLPLELGYRIWDFCIAHYQNQQAMKARLIAMFTLCIFQEKSCRKPIYPINYLIQAMQSNFSKYSLEQRMVPHYTKSMKLYTKHRSHRKQTVREYAQQNHLRKFVFGKETDHNFIPDEDTKKKEPIKGDNHNKSQTNHIYNSTFNSHGKQQLKEADGKIHNKLMSLNNLSYPLPRPGYQGSTVTGLYLFIGAVSILKNINLKKENYWLRVSIDTTKNVLKRYLLQAKQVYLNQFLEVGREGSTAKSVILQLTRIEGDRTVLRGCLSLAGLHKNMVYSEQIVLEQCFALQKSSIHNKDGQDSPIHAQSNLGLSVIGVTIIIRSTQRTNISNQNALIDKTDFRETEMAQKLLNYDLQESNNEGVRQLQSLGRTIMKILDPLDQFDSDKYSSLKFPVFNQHRQVSQWLANSKVSVEELKAIFGAIFEHHKEEDLRLKFANFYEDYSKDYQEFEFGKFLLELVLIAPVSLLKKISMLFCIGVHYQDVQTNEKTSKLTVETLNSLIRQICLSSGFLNACPYSTHYLGQIIYAGFYQKGIEKEITQILRDWAAILRYKYKTDAVVLGSAADLQILRFLLPSNILDRIQSQQLCKFQIVYQKDGLIYVWSVTVQTRDFSIVTRGMKFLNTYPKYHQPLQSISSVCETLLNFQNHISLRTSQSITYDQFIQQFKNNHMLAFILNSDQSPSTELSKYHPKSHKLNGMLSSRSSLVSVAIDVKSNTHDFGIFRYHHSYSEWRKCRKYAQKSGSSNVIVEFQGLKGLYEIPTYEYICMEQSLAYENIGNQSDQPSRYNSRIF